MKNQVKTAMIIKVIAVLFLLFLIIKNKWYSMKSLLNAFSGDVLERAASFIIPLEGFVSTAFWDYKQYTYGYGTKAGAAGEKITKEEAKIQLIDRIKSDLRIIESYNITLTDNQKVALLSFGFNCGAQPLRLQLNRLRNGSTKEFVASMMRKYINAGGKIHQGLVARRQKESDLFLK